MAYFTFPQDPKLVAFAGDWHANQRYALRALRWAAKQGVDTLVHVGDFGFTFSPGWVQTVNQAAEDSGITILFVDGNHDDHRFLRTLKTTQPGVMPLGSSLAYLPRGFTWTWWGKKFLALGGAHSIDRRYRTEGVDWWPEELLTLSDCLRAQEAGEVWGMVTHDVPLKTSIPGITREEGLRWIPEEDLDLADQNRAALQEVVETVKPQHLWAGHYHLRKDLPLVDAARGGEVHILSLDGSPFWENMDLLGENGRVLSPQELSPFPGA